MTNLSVGGELRVAHSLVVNGGNENSMSRHIGNSINRILPSGIEIVFDATSPDGNRPDYTLKRGHAVIGYLEAKLPSTLGAAFQEDATGEYQVDKYRASGLPVLLTDGLRWYDVTDGSAWNPRTFNQRINKPFADFSDKENDEQSELALKTLFNAALNIKPRYSVVSAPMAMQSVIARINNAHNDQLESAWKAVKKFLRHNAAPVELGDGQVGELIAFTLLAVAATLEPLSDESFVDDANREWREESRSWQSNELPSTLRSALNDFRRIDGESGDTLLGSLGWVTLRSVASSIRKRGAIDWDLLSSLWDNYLGLAGQRARLGSWQTPPAVAEYQAKLTSESLKILGYIGFSDPRVTVIDPCCGTGVYMQEVIKQVEREGGTAAGLSASANSHSRLIGSDISPTAVAATHIRVSSYGVRPNLYMADTLNASPEVGTATGVAGNQEMLGLFTFDEFDFDAALVRAVKRDHTELTAWAGRKADRDPLVAIIGNPPYGRSMMNPANYKDRGWYEEVFNYWRKGSGGGGSLQDPFVGFLAWAFRICQIPHEQSDVGTPFGVVSFITNRSWVDGKTFAPFRSWLREKAASIRISDFGLGSRGGASGHWSEQPFAIETGTAILTVIFDPTHLGEATVSYQKVAWINDQVELVGEAVLVSQNSNWTGAVPPRELFEKNYVTNGVKTGSDSKWIRTRGDREFGLRHAYRVFDNRYSPSVIPHDASSGSEWRVKKLFRPHTNNSQRPNWYLIGQARSAKPGPALHATKHLPDYHFFKGSEGGRVLPIRESTPVPADYTAVAETLNVSGLDFWYLTLAVAHHYGYWTEGSELAKQLAEVRVEPPYPQDTAHVEQLIEIGKELVDLWSLDTVTPVPFTGRPGMWVFEGNNEAELIVLHNRKVLVEWRKARPGEWDRNTATEYARSIAAVSRTLELSRFVRTLLD